MARKSIYDKRYKAVIDKLIEARKDAGLTQQQVADKLKRPQSYVAKYERRERRIDIIELEDIEEVLGINIRNNTHQ